MQSEANGSLRLISQLQGKIQGFSIFWSDARTENPSTILNSRHLSQLDLDRALHGTGIYHSYIRELHLPDSQTERKFKGVWLNPSFVARDTCNPFISTFETQKQ
jgi:hypothetical protein